MSEYTRGEWDAGDDDGSGKWRIGAEGKLIASIYGDSAEAEANAYLIAAAPDMLEALLAAREYVAEVMGRRRRAGYNPIPTKHHLIAIDAAIAKAKGHLK